MPEWIVESVNMKITLPPHRVARLKEIVSSIPRTQHRVGVDKWHRVIGELRSMALALPRDSGFFIQMQEALCHVKGKIVALSTGVHEALEDFKWLDEDVANRPTCMYELFPLQPTVDGYHNASGYMCGVWCSRDQPPYLRNCRHSLGLRGPPQTPKGNTP